MTGSPFAIDGRPIGPGAPTYIIAELSANHRQDRGRAEALVRAAAASGADAVKVQLYTPDTLTLDADTDPFRIDAGTPWDGRRLHELYAEAYMPWEWYEPLAALAHELALHCFPSVYDETATAYAAARNAPAYKIASFELVDIPLLRIVAGAGKPIVLSTGMASLDEIDEAMAALEDAGAPPVAVLRTNSGYPASPTEMHLRAISTLVQRYRVPVGLSDHTLGIGVPIAAVALGASIVEKHLTLSRADGGPDAGFSLEPPEFAAMVDAVRVAEAAIGESTFGPTEHERGSLPFRRSLFVARDVRAGDRFTSENLRSVRPAAGLHPRHLPEILGRRVKRDAPIGTPLTWDLVGEAETT